MAAGAVSDAATVAALARAAAVVSASPEFGTLPNGVVIFCSEQVMEAFSPPRPLTGRPTCCCADSFDALVVGDALAARRGRSFGVVAIDGSEATLGIVQEPLDVGPGVGRHGGGGRGRWTLHQLRHVRANIASRTRRGGQSAARYARNRDGEETSFLRKVAEFMREDVGDLRGVVLAGAGDLKRKLLLELPASARSRIARVVDIPCNAGPEGLRIAAAHVPELAALGHEQEVQAVVARFLDLTSRGPAAMVCYGEAEVAAALRFGVVEWLLVSSALVTRGNVQWVDLAATSGAAVLEVRADTEVSHRFDGFGVGAILRFAIDPGLLEESLLCLDTSSSEEEEHRSCSSLVATAAGRSQDNECCASDQASTAVSSPREVPEAALLVWLRSALRATLKDPAAADSLTICAELILFDEVTPLEERMDTVTETLRSEGVAEDVLVELTVHAADHLEASA